MKNLLKYIAVFLLALTAFNCSKNNILYFQKIGSAVTIYQADIYNYMYKNNNLPVLPELHAPHNTVRSITNYNTWPYETL